MQMLSSSSRIEPSEAEDSRGDRLNYRADVDGLRAVAILGVILFHANLGVPGGFAGVDVFFVISGFLITRIVTSEITAGSFSLLRFWERRARRILPALAVVVVACLVAGYFLLLPFGFEVLGQTALSVVLLSSNFFFWKTNNYFSPDAKENPLLHTWSLGVEEQFYLLYPLLLLLLLPRGKVMAVVGLSALCAASLWCSVSWVSSHPVAAFYLLPSRAWEMGLGGLVALHECRIRGWKREYLSWGGLLAVVASFALLSRYTPFPGWSALPAVAGTALVIWSGSGLAGNTRPPAPNRLLSLQPLVFIGLISYSLYLWHWPFFAFHRYLFGQPAPAGLGLLYLVCALALSVASYRWIEQPIRRKVLLPDRKAVFWFWAGSTAAIAALGFLLAFTDGWPGRISPQAREFESLQGQPRNAFFQAGPEGAHVMQASLGAADLPAKVFVWGDSHAMALAPALDAAGKELDVSVATRAMQGNAPVLGWTIGPSESRGGLEMAAFNKRVFSEIQERAASGELDVVVLVFRWATYVQREPPLEQYDPLPGFEDALLETVRKLDDLGVQVVVLLEPPAFPVPVPKALALHDFIGTPAPSLSAENVRAFTNPYQGLIESLKSGGEKVTLLDLSPALTTGDGAIRAVDDDGALLYSDDHHLSYRGAVKMTAPLRDTIGSLLRTDVSNGAGQ